MPSPCPGDSLIDALNCASKADATKMLEPVLERSPWLARRLAEDRPFSDRRNLASCIASQIKALSDEERLILLRAHPELAPAEPAQMTISSRSEQGRLSLDRIDEKLGARLRHLNEQYLARHGFPFIIALHAEKDIDAVLDRFASCLEQDTATEITRALDEVVSVATARLAQQATSSGTVYSEGDA